MLNPDFRDMLSALLEAEAEFVVVGAFALAAHGNPRATGDIDLLVRPTVGNARRVMEALARFGAPLSEIDEADFSMPDTDYQIGLPPRRIDLLTALEGIPDFDTVWQGRMPVEVDGLTFPVIGRAELLANKRALGRPQDLADVAWLEAQGRRD